MWSGLFFFLFRVVGCDWVHLGRQPQTDLLYQPDDGWVWAIWWNDNWQGKPKYSAETRPPAILSPTNPKWLDLESNSGRRGGKPATNCLSYGTAYKANCVTSFAFTWLSLTVAATCKYTELLWCEDITYINSHKLSHNRRVLSSGI
jgi:hypothetical protein